MIINLLVLAVSAYLVVAVFILMKRNKKNKQYIECIDLLDDREAFFVAIDKFKDDLSDIEFKTKGQIIKLYGAALHQDMELLETLIDEIDLSHLIMNKGKINRKLISLNEDSFYYYCFLTHFFLYQNQRTDLIESLYNKIKLHETALEGQFFYEIYLASMDIYRGESDHIQYFKNILNGEYGGYYAKQMIGLYKKTVACMLAKLELSVNPDADLGDMMKDLVAYQRTKLGTRILTTLGINEAIYDADVVDYKKEKDDEEITGN